MPRTLEVRIATLGSALWIGWMLGLEPGATDDSSRHAQRLLALAVSVVVPLVLARALPRKDSGAPAPVLWFVLPAALSLMLGLSRPAGPVATALALPWAIVGLELALVGVRGLRRTLLHRSPLHRTIDRAAPDVGLVFLAIGSGAAVMSCAGLRPLGFADVIVLLTAVHFHYAGLVLPTLGSLVLRALGWTSLRWSLWAIVIGTPVTAGGIALSPGAEAVGALAVGLGGVTVGVAHVALALRSRGAAVSLLLAVSGLSLIYAMALAGSYAVSTLGGTSWPAIPDMIELHGTANALGFALLGSWAWTLMADDRMQEERDGNTGQ